ncbi:hypothetical protein TH53_04325 [Pedobacter lusitanus]|uniref:Uncharacterized protein n=1 Tax=Pedobacter lusitanus TaxID=1503925 RepID=A0A0D0G0D5_9SPHI|nr:hypothetical protein [Pedobacter lusitanus]KIO78249.1 hypothetical protein TH53_04325 [Pedobacter lusitanus]
MFNFLRKKEAETMPANLVLPDEPTNRFSNTIDIPENVFIENDKDLPVDNEGQKIENNIELLFDFLDKNHETKGYEDALMNPDISHLEHNVLALKNQLERTIRRVKTFYEDFIKEIDFHIDSRARSGMVDVVDELKMKKSIAESHVQKVLDIEEEAQHNKGDSQGMIISYTRGFMNGLSAISHHTILNRF